MIKGVGVSMNRVPKRSLLVIETHKSRATRQEQEIKAIRIGKEGIKLLLFTDSVIDHLLFSISHILGLAD